MIVTVVAAVTAVVVIANCLELVPAPTAIVAGTVAWALFELSLITSPAPAARPPSVTVPVVPAVPVTEELVSDRLEMGGTVTPKEPPFP